MMHDRSYRYNEPLTVPLKREVFINGKWIEYDECSRHKKGSPNLRKIGIGRVFRINGGYPQVDRETLYYYKRINKK